MPILAVQPRKYTRRPGRVAAIRGIIFQSDAKSTIGHLFIRPMARLDRRIVGISRPSEEPPLPIHAAIHVEMEDGRAYVAEQLIGTLYLLLRNGLRWTPLEEFRRRDRGGWDVTVDARAFRGVGDQQIEATMARLNTLQGEPFLREDCTSFIERAFGQNLFADSPLLRDLGVGIRVGDPALALLKPEARLDPRATRLLDADALKRLPDAAASPPAPVVRVWGVGLGSIVLLGIVAGLLLVARRYESCRAAPRFA